MKTTVDCGGYKLEFGDEHVIAPEEITCEGDYNPHNRRLWVLHVHGLVLCVVEGDCLQDAIDEAVDCDKLDGLLIDPSREEDRSVYMTTDPSEIAAGFDASCPEYESNDGTKWFWKVEPAFLGNASEPFDISGLGYAQLPLPKRSVTRLFGDAVQAEDCFVPGTGGARKSF